MYCTQRYDATVRIVRFISYQSTHIDAHTLFSLKILANAIRKERKSKLKAIGLVLVLSSDGH